MRAYVSVSVCVYGWMGNKKEAAKEICFIIYF